MGPDNGKEKKVIDLDYDDDPNDQEEPERPVSNTHYRNAELAMLCTKSVRRNIKKMVLVFFSFLFFRNFCLLLFCIGSFMLIFRRLLALFENFNWCVL